MARFITYVVIILTLVALARTLQQSHRHRITRGQGIYSRSTKYICMEDETDIDRSVKNLGIACKCPMISAPVCGSDNITYHNRCFMHCRARHAINRYHRYRLTLKHFGECNSTTTGVQSVSRFDGQSQ